jgi:hypothetical protein
VPIASTDLLDPVADMNDAGLNDARINTAKIQFPPDW